MTLTISNPYSITYKLWNLAYRDLVNQHLPQYWLRMTAKEKYQWVDNHRFKVMITQQDATEVMEEANRVFSLLVEARAY